MKERKPLFVIRDKKTNVIFFYMLFTAVFIISFLSCSHKNDKPVEFKSMFTLIDSLLLGDSNSISQPIDVAELDDSLFVYTDFWARSIFYYNRKTGRIKKLGRTGKGPGEYIWPEKLIVRERKILFSDFQARTIQNIDISGKCYSKISCNVPIRRFCVDDSLNYYVLSAKEYNLFVFNRSGNLIKKLYPVNKKYKYPISVSHGGGICYDGKGHLFLSSVVGDKIFKLNTADLSSEQEISRKKSPVYREVPKEIQGDLYLNLKPETRRKFVNKMSVLMNLYFIDSGKGYIAVSLKDYEDLLVMEIRNTNLKLLKTVFFQDNEYPIGCTKDEFYTIEEKSESGNKDTEETVEFWLKIYHIKSL